MITSDFVLNWIPTIPLVILWLSFFHWWFLGRNVFDDKMAVVCMQCGAPIMMASGNKCSNCRQSLDDKSV